MTERTLFPADDLDKPPEPLPHSGSPTSKAAADSMKPLAGQQRERVRQFFVECGQHGATQQEAELALDIPGNSIRPRCKELEEAGEIQNSGNTRKTTSGRAAAVWVERSHYQAAVTSKANWSTDGKSNPDVPG